MSSSNHRNAPDEPAASWTARLDGVEVRFVGRGTATPSAARESRDRVLRRIAPASLELAWLRQIHSARVLAARPALTGEGDALWTRRRGLALSIATADCVPVVLATTGSIAAAHAGWRGIVAGIVPATIDALDPNEPLTAWLGPAIGACCYEVGDDVAAKIADSSAPEVIATGTKLRAHADLRRAVEVQLARSGVEDIRRLGGCTACDRSRLWSYRRDGPRAGRNLAFAWLRD